MELLTTVEAAERIGLSAKSLRSLVVRGEIAVYRLGPGGGKVRFTQQDLLDYEERCRKFGPREAPRPTISDDVRSEVSHLRPANPRRFHREGDMLTSEG